MPATACETVGPRGSVERGVGRSWWSDISDFRRPIASTIQGPAPYGAVILAPWRLSDGAAHLARSSNYASTPPRRRMSVRGRTSRTHQLLVHKYPERHHLANTMW